SEVVASVEESGGEAFVSAGVRRTIIGVVGDADVLAALEAKDLTQLNAVSEVIRITSAYKLVSRENHTTRSTVMVGNVAIGPESITLIAGPCAVETPEQTLAAAHQAVQAGATLLRGGAFKPRTSPYAFQGLGIPGLQILAEVGREVGLPTVTEIVDARDVDVVAEHADMLQIGTRNMQNFALLQAAGGAGKPVLLKRGLTATYEEWLMAAEYIAQRGNLDIVLCERGIRTFEPSVRNTLDVSAVPVIQDLSHLPIIVDPSHAAGRRDLILPLARAGLAAGADGLIIDVHPHPESALCDGAQALFGQSLTDLAHVMATFPAMLGRNQTVQ
ncbi:MAG: 3-deoxy-7-phosphoheptulonate synthase, partial [Antricoccus sp.]